MVFIYKWALLVNEKQWEQVLFLSLFLFYKKLVTKSPYMIKTLMILSLSNILIFLSMPNGRDHKA